MAFFVQATDSEKPTSIVGQRVAFLSAIVLIIMVVAQLFRFDKLIPVFVALPIATAPFSQLLLSLLVICEVLALPFLLRMKLSPLMRTVSMISGWIVVVKWLYILVMLALTAPAVSNVGLLGTTVPIASSFTSVLIMVVIVGMIGYSSYSLWPRRSTIS